MVRMYGCSLSIKTTTNLSMTLENNLLKENKKIKVSSVLQRDVKNYGKQYLIDGNEDTCWNSDQVTTTCLLLKTYIY